MGRQYTLGAQHHCSCSPASRHLAGTSCPVLLPPTAQSCLPDLGVPPLPPAAHVHPPGMGREGRTAAWPHLAPTAAPAAGLWPCLPLDCASFCHGPMASGMSVLWAQGVFVRAEPVGRGLWPSPASQAGAGENRSQGHLHGQKLPLAWPHSSQPGSAVSPLLQGLTGRKAPSPSSLPLQHQQPGGGSILHTPSAWGPAPTPAQSWHHLGEPQHPYQGMPWAQPARKGSRRAGGQENQAAAAVSAPATGNVLGPGLSRAWPRCVKQTIYSTYIPPRQEWPAFLLHGTRCLGATGVIPTTTLSGPCQMGEISSKKGLLAACHLLPRHFH